MRLSTLSAAAALAAFAAGAVNAQPAAPPVKKTDPNEIICERQKIPGSRLAAAKVCKTRAEWAEARAQDRMDLERAQTQRGTKPQ